MMCTYESKFRYLIFFTGLLFFVAAPFYLTEFFYPSFQGTNGVSFLVFAAFCITEGILSVGVFIRWKKLTPVKACTFFSRYEFAVNPFLTFSVLSLASIFPQAARDWLYFTNIGITVALFATRLFMVIFLTHYMQKGETGYLPFRNHYYIDLSFTAIIFNYYVLSIVKSIGVDTSLISKGEIVGYSEFFLIITVLEIAIGMLVLLQSMFMSLATYFSAKENTPFDFRTNLSASKRLFEKYEIPFWIGIFATFILLVISIMSMIAEPNVYAPLAFLYLFVLIIRLPAFFRKRAICKKYGSSLDVVFKKEHVILMFAAVFFLIYAVITIVFGQYVLEKVGQLERTAFLTFGIFVPWSLVKLFLGTKSYIYAKKKGDPIILMNSYIDVLLAIYTIAKVVAIVATQAKLDAVRIIAIVLAALIAVYCIYISIKMLVIGILGRRGKRTNAFALYEKANKEEQ